MTSKNETSEPSHCVISKNDASEPSRCVNFQNDAPEPSRCVNFQNDASEPSRCVKNSIQADLADYLRRNYVELPEGEQELPQYGPAGETVKAGLSEKESRSLEQLVKEVGESFHEKLFSRIRESGMSDVEVYKSAGVDRKLFSKIRNNPAYHPKKQTILALAIALKLNIDETVDLLARAEYALSPGNKGDLIVRFFIERGIYDIMSVNFALDEYGQPPLE